MNINTHLNLDTHLQLQLLEFAQKQGTLTQQLKLKQLQLLLKTRLFEQIGNKTKELQSANQNIEKTLHKLEKQSKKEEEELGGEATIDELFDLDDDIKDQQYTSETLQLFSNAHKLSKYYYEVGNYTEARSILGQLDFFIEKESPLWLSIAWGKINSEIILNRVDVLIESVRRLKFKIENTPYATTELAISQKQAFLNICCFVFFRRNKEQDYEAFLDICSEESYFSTIQMVCPYILRYICIAMLLNKSYQRYGKFFLPSLTGALERNLFNYSDHLTEFMKRLLVKFDFQGAKTSLHSVQSILKQDYFISSMVSQIKTSAEVLYYETYCKIYESLPIKSISGFLNKPDEEAEQWIVQLFRRSGISAKIDSISGIIDINRTAWLKSNQANSFQELIPRTNTIVNNLARILVI